MSRRRRRPVIAAALIERADNRLLIALPRGAARLERWWCFPHGPVEVGESPEVAMRRIAREDLGVRIEIVVGQPPLLMDLEERRVDVRFFFCGLAIGDAKPGPYQEVRWVSQMHLREYDFDVISTPVVDWLLEGGRA